MTVTASVQSHWEANSSHVISEKWKSSLKSFVKRKKESPNGKTKLGFTILTAFWELLKYITAFQSFQSIIYCWNNVSLQVWLYLKNVTYSGPIWLHIVQHNCSYGHILIATVYVWEFVFELLKNWRPLISLGVARKHKSLIKENNSTVNAPLLHHSSF